MTARSVGLRETILSTAVFGAVLFALVSSDPRVEAQVNDLMRTASVTTWSGRLGDLGSTVWDSARDHSIDNAPLLVFAAVGTVLTLFMFKS